MFFLQDHALVKATDGCRDNTGERLADSRQSAGSSEPSPQSSTVSHFHQNGMHSSVPQRNCWDTHTHTHKHTHQHTHKKQENTHKKTVSQHMYTQACGARTHTHTHTHTYTHTHTHTHTKGHMRPFAHKQHTHHQIQSEHGNKMKALQSQSIYQYATAKRVAIPQEQANSQQEQKEYAP